MLGCFKTRGKWLGWSRKAVKREGNAPLSDFILGGARVDSQGHGLGWSRFGGWSRFWEPVKWAWRGSKRLELDPRDGVEFGMESILGMESIWERGKMGLEGVEKTRTPSWASVL